MEKPHVSLLKQFLRKKRIKVDENEFEFQLLSHPSYPSLHSITGVLDHFSIKNYALEIPKSFEALELLPSVFLAHIKNQEYTGFTLVIKQEFGFQLSFNDSKKQLVLFNNFLDIWTGVIVIIEDEEQEVKHNVKKEIFSKIIFYLTPIILISVFFFYRTNSFQTIHFSLSIIGCFICGLIIQHELGLHSIILDKFCSQDTKKTSCDAVLNSKGAQLFKLFKLSDIGIIYFASMLILWLFITIGKSSYNPIIIITALAIPFTFFSIFYQLIFVKKWCLLCLSVVSVLWLQAASLFFLRLNKALISLSIESLILTAFSFFATVALWQFISPRLKKEQELRALKIEHFKFKRNYNIYKSLIKGSDQIDTYINNTKEIIFGTKKEAPLLEIVVITNPLCGFCKEAHVLVENLLKITDKSLNIIIRFNVADDSNSLDSKISQRLLEIFNLDGDKICLNAMHDIYSNITPKEWLIKWGEPSKPEYKTTLTLEKEWCKQQNINFTPEVLVNGRPFPKEYDRIDLISFVDEIIEEADETANVETHELGLVN